MSTAPVALFTLRDAPAAARLATQWACPPALLDWPIVVGEGLRRRDLHPKPDGVGAPLAADLGALIELLAEGLRAALGAEGALPAGFSAAATLEAARLALAGRRIWVPRAAAVEEGRVAEALALLEGEGMEDIVDWVGQGGPMPSLGPIAAAVDATELGALVAEALGPRPERWELGPTGRLLDLWVALRAPDAHLPLGEADEEGLFDRAGVVAELLAARGLATGLIACSLPRTWGSSRMAWAGALSQAEGLVASAASDLEAAALCLRLLDLGPTLGQSPTLRAQALAALASPNLAPLLGPWALVAAVESFGAGVARAFSASRWNTLLAADLGHRGTLALAQTLALVAPALHTDRPAEATATLFSGPRLDAEALSIGHSVIGLLDAPAAWGRLLDQLEADGAPSPAALRQVLGLLRALGRPSKPARQRLARLCEGRGAAFGPAQAGLFRLAGLQPPPGTEEPFAALDEALAAAGLALAPGNSAEALAEAELSLGAPMPSTLREFYAWQDGSGGVTVCAGRILRSLAEALALRAALVAAPERPLNAALLPILDDGAGVFLCVVLWGAQAGGLVEFDLDADEDCPIAADFVAWLALQRWG